MESQKSNILYKISTCIIFNLENFFYWYGKSIAKRPLCFIVVCLLITLSLSVGIIKFTKEDRPFKLWIPQNSDFIKVMNWQTENFPQKFRSHVVIYEAENVLTREGVLEMLRIHELVSKTVTDKATWSTVCAKLPVIEYNIFGRKKRYLKDSNLGRYKRQSWLLSLLSRDEYCYILETVRRECIEHSLLEIWGYDYRTVNLLSDEDILRDINKATVSTIYGFETNFTKFLGSIQRNEEGLIIAAKAMQHIWITEINEEALEEDIIDDSGTGMTVDKSGFEWEQELVKRLLNESQKSGKLDIYLMVMSSFGVISGSTIRNDAKYLGLGFFIVFIYVQIMLGKFNLVEQRPILSLFGISSVGLSIGVSYGFCSFIGIPFGPVNNVLPFLLLGLGIDDMFVFMQAWNNLDAEEKQCTLPVRVGFALKHAGVSITITSLTDFVVFAIGCTTVLPALKSFCLYAAVGIIAVYFFQATYFIAWFTLDQKRLEDKRVGLLWCLKLKDWSPNTCSQKDLCQLFFKDIYSEFLLKRPIKICILIFSACLLGISGWGLSNLEQEFNPIWFLPQNSYLFKFFMKLEEHFPSDGEEGVVFFGNISLFDNIHQLDKFVKSLKNDEFISEVDSWHDKFKEYWNDFDFTSIQSITEVEFSGRLSEFLYSPSGSRYRLKNFKFDGSFNCTDLSPKILVFTMDYKHKILHGSYHKIKAMENVKDLINSMNFSGYVKPWARIYSGWETDKIIEVELYQNLTVAMVVVGVMTLALIASCTTSLMVLLCVVMTLIDVGALMYWWGLTIDTVSCIDLVLAVGLCVDYAAHIGHTFMIQKGSKDRRVKDTLGKIGPAVLNGGFSTFLAFVFLAGSDSHVFRTFFKIFFAVCMFGLFHGLVFLPVLLSLIGPPPYKSSINKSSENQLNRSNEYEMNSVSGKGNSPNVLLPSENENFSGETVIM